MADANMEYDGYSSEEEKNYYESLDAQAAEAEAVEAVETAGVTEGEVSEGETTVTEESAAENVAEEAAVETGAEEIAAESSGEEAAEDMQASNASKIEGEPTVDDSQADADDDIAVAAIDEETQDLGADEPDNATATMTGAEADLDSQDPDSASASRSEVEFNITAEEQPVVEATEDVEQDIEPDPPEEETPEEDPIEPDPPEEETPEEEQDEEQEDTEEDESEPVVEQPTEPTNPTITTSSPNVSVPVASSDEIETIEIEDEDVITSIEIDQTNEEQPKKECVDFGAGIESDDDYIPDDYEEADPGAGISSDNDEITDTTSNEVSSFVPPERMEGEDAAAYAQRVEAERIKYNSLSNVGTTTDEALSAVETNMETATVDSSEAASNNSAESDSTTEKPDPYAYPEFEMPERPSGMPDSAYESYVEGMRDKYEAEKAEYIDSVNQQAAEDIWVNGAFGSGEERVDNLEAAGYDVDAVQQAIVDKYIEPMEAETAAVETAQANAEASVSAAYELEGTGVDDTLERVTETADPDMIYDPVTDSYTAAPIEETVEATADTVEAEAETEDEVEDEEEDTAEITDNSFDAKWEITNNMNVNIDTSSEKEDDYGLGK